MEAQDCRGWTMAPEWQQSHWKGTWEFDPNIGSIEEREAVDSARKEFQKNRFRTRHSSDILARMQV